MNNTLHVHCMIASQSPSASDLDIHVQAPLPLGGFLHVSARPSDSHQFCSPSYLSSSVLCAALFTLVVGLQRRCKIKCRPIQQRKRQLVDSGPTWRTPSVAGVLRNLPFMRHAPPQVLEVSTPSSAAPVMLQSQTCSSNIFMFICF